jgi:hypothetical protein
MAERLKAIEKNINELYRKTARRGFGIRDNEASEHQDAELCVVKHDVTVPRKNGITADDTLTSAEIDDALLARRGHEGALQRRPCAARYRRAEGLFLRK